jgi:hypothetical protein
MTPYKDLFERGVDEVNEEITNALLRTLVRNKLDPQGKHQTCLTAFGGRSAP